MRRGVLVVLCLLACALTTAAGPQAAGAATTTDYASWTFTGSDRDFDGTVGLAAGFPAVTLRTDSRTPPTPAVASGATAWLPTGTPFANLFGSSQDQPYLNLRPSEYDVSSPSTTIYTFARPTPAGTWGINLGDIDAETLTVSATGVGGAAVAATDLGFGGAYNYCDATLRAAACTGTAAPYAVPDETATATVVTLADLACPTTSARCNTTGEAAFFVPQVPLTSLTVTSTWKQGLPSYQTWFATLRGTITGAVTDECGAPAGLRVQLLDAAGTVIGSQPAAVGTYSFAALARGEGYSVRIDPATLPAGATAAPHPIASLGQAATAPDLVVREARTVSGTVTGDDVDGLTVTLDPAGAGAARTTTTANGGYSFAAVPAGEYAVTVTPRARHTVDPAARAVTVSCATVDVASFTVVAAPPTTPPPTTVPSSSSAPSTTASSSAASSSIASSSASSSDTSAGAAPTGVATAPVGELANTGAPTTRTVAVGVVAIALGAGLVLLARRRVRPRRA